MALKVEQFSFPSGYNDSIQIGDLVYYALITTSGGFDISSTDQVTLFGQVYGIGSNYVQVMYDDAVFSPSSIPNNSHYMMFSKDPEVNVSRLTGGYMKVGFKNNSEESAELFSVGAEVNESSK